jgi:hypothetical protein
MIHDLNASSQAKIYSVEDAMKQNVYEFLGIVDQLRIAHRLAIAVLQYETPWLPDHWRLLDMKYLETSGTMDATALRTLHLSSEIKKRPNTAQTDGIKFAKDAVTNQMRQGITNSTLFCLGVALLEIAYWSPIEEKATEDDDNNPVLTARRLQKDRAPPLGPEFKGSLNGVYPVTSALVISLVRRAYNLRSTQMLCVNWKSSSQIIPSWASNESAESHF